MTCERIALPGGGVAIVCSRGRRGKPCCVCGGRARRLCDWKLTGRKAGKTCSLPVCDRHTTQPAPDKDLCPVHARAWETHPSNPNRRK